MKNKLAEKMLREKLDFLSLEDSIELHDAGVEVKSRFWWVALSEELPDNGYDMSIREVVDMCEDIYGSDYGITIGDQHEQFDEFTLKLCPAPTYIDLIR